jgi:hypothetical protein
MEEEPEAEEDDIPGFEEPPKTEPAPVAAPVRTVTLGGSNTGRVKEWLNLHYTNMMDVRRVMQMIAEANPGYSESAEKTDQILADLKRGKYALEG